MRGHRTHSNSARRHSVSTYFHDEEFTLIVLAAAQARLAPGAWVAEAAYRSAVLERTDLDWEKLDRLRDLVELLGRRLEKIGHNVNQVVTRWHATGEVAANASAVLAAARMSAQRVDELVEVISRMLS